MEKEILKSFALLLKGKRYRDCGGKFLGLAIDQHRLIPPLSNGFECRLRQGVVSRPNLNIRDFAFLVDVRMKDDISLDLGGAGLRRIFRVRLRKDGSRSDIGGRLGGRRGSF
jgi:hypothetical protein